jgi:hypothetical protein
MHQISLHLGHFQKYSFLILLRRVTDQNCTTRVRTVEDNLISVYYIYISWKSCFYIGMFGSNLNLKKYTETSII